jgi:hypothetical protein
VVTPGREACRDQRAVRDRSANEGPIGPQGPGAISLDGQVTPNTGDHLIRTVDGVSVILFCTTTPIHEIDLEVTKANPSDFFYGWGTRWEEGDSTPKRVEGIDTGLEEAGQVVTGLDVVAAATAPGQPVKQVSIDVNVILSSACNYHGVIIPSV